SAFLFVLLGFFYLKYTTKVYESSARVLVKDDKQNSISSGLALFEDLGVLSGSGNVQNEIEILKSRTLITSVARNLRLNLKYMYSEEEELSGEILPENLPFTIVFEQGDSSVYKNEGLFTVTPLSAKNVRVEGPFVSKSGTYDFGTPIPTKVGNITVLATSIPTNKWINQTVQVELLKIDDVITNL